MWFVLPENAHARSPYAASCFVGSIELIAAEGSTSFAHIDSSLGCCLFLAASHLHSVSTKSALLVPWQRSRASVRRGYARTASSAYSRAVHKATNRRGRDGQVFINPEEQPLPDTVCYSSYRYSPRRGRVSTGKAGPLCTFRSTFADFAFIHPLLTAAVRIRSTSLVFCLLSFGRLLTLPLRRTRNRLQSRDGRARLAPGDVLGPS